MRLKKPTELEGPSPDEKDEEMDLQPPARRAAMIFREDRWLDRIRAGVMLFVSLTALAVVFTFVFHLTAPQDYRWLTNEETEYIKTLSVTIIVGLVMSGITLLFLKKRP